MARGVAPAAAAWCLAAPALAYPSYEACTPQDSSSHVRIGATAMGMTVEPWTTEYGSWSPRGDWTVTISRSSAAATVNGIYRGSGTTVATDYIPGETLHVEISGVPNNLPGRGEKGPYNSSDAQSYLPGFAQWILRASRGSRFGKELPAVSNPGQFEWVCDNQGIFNCPYPYNCTNPEVIQFTLVAPCTGDLVVNAVASNGMTRSTGGAKPCCGTIVGVSSATLRPRAGAAAEGACAGCRGNDTCCHAKPCGPKSSQCCNPAQNQLCGGGSPCCACPAGACECAPMPTTAPAGCGAACADDADCIPAPENSTMSGCTACVNGTCLMAGTAAPPAPPAPPALVGCLELCNDGVHSCDNTTECSLCMPIDANGTEFRCSAGCTASCTADEHCGTPGCGLCKGGVCTVPPLPFAACEGACGDGTHDCDPAAECNLCMPILGPDGNATGYRCAAGCGAPCSRDEHCGGEGCARCANYSGGAQCSA